MKMYLTIVPSKFIVNGHGTSRRTGSAVFAAADFLATADFLAVPHCPKPPARKRRF